MTALERDDSQGNILRGYNFPCARYLVARVRDDPAAAEAARRWLATQADPAMSDAEWTEAPRVAGNVALSWAGLRALRLPGWLLASFPADFREGMAARAALIGDTGEAAPDRWDEGLRPGDIHVLVTLQARDPEALARTAARVRGEMAANGLDPGVEQPAVAGVARHGIPGQGVPIRRRPWHRRSADVVASAVDRRLAWRALRAGEFVLGYEDEDGGLPPAPAAPLHRTGSYMVWRKLRQDVAGFRAWVAGAAAATGWSPDLLAAKVVGRWPDGSPLVLRPGHGDHVLGNDRGRVNDFSYGGDPEGLACPRGAHVRRANPRDGLRGGGRLTARHRILRRGMPYGEPFDPANADDSGDRGLVFVALQASIERQFEIVQARWLNDGDAFGLGRTADPVAGAVACPARQAFGGRPPRYATALRSFVTPRGGEYLFVPAISGLRALANL